MDDTPVRLDKWLWASRLVKTRALAAEAVTGGRVHLNGKATKPSKDVRPGDRLEVTIGHLRWTVDVLGTAERRGPASEAQQLYAETPESVEQRRQAAAERRAASASAPLPVLGGRPTKRDRRRFDQSRGR